MEEGRKFSPATSGEVEKVAPIKESAPLRLEFSDHALVRFIQRGVSASPIPALLKRLCQAKVGERVAVQVADEVIVGVRADAQTAKIVTAWRKGEPHAS